MNPIIIKGLSIFIVSAATLVVTYLLLKNRRIQPNQYHAAYSYNKDFSNDEFTASQCSICLEEMSANDKNKIFVLPCRHRFHRECIKEWFSYQTRGVRQCPCCRKRVDESVVSRCIS